MNVAVVDQRDEHGGRYQCDHITLDQQAPHGLPSCDVVNPPFFRAFLPVSFLESPCHPAVFRYFTDLVKVHDVAGECFISGGTDVVSVC